MNSVYKHPDIQQNETGMTDLLNNLEKDINDIETDILLAFKQLQDIPSESDDRQLSPEFRREMRFTLRGLLKSITQTASREQLKLTTKKQEDLRKRLYGINQLLDSRVPAIVPGKAIFVAKDIASVMDTALSTQKKTTEIARTPEEIRKKLASRQKQTDQGRATFESRDISATATDVNRLKEKLASRQPISDKDKKA